jgi:sodium/potassium/calcium exchanger 6
MTFVQAIMWLNISANCLVQLCVIVGVIFGVKPALLGATVLAYGNSIPDLMNNLSLARDGFPSMAVAACFAGPMFSMMVGMSSALAYGAAINHGMLHVPVDGPLLVMVAFGVVNLLKYLLVVPLAYKFKMSRKMTVTSFLYYACFNVVYGLVIAGVISLDSVKHWLGCCT